MLTATVMVAPPLVLAEEIPLHVEISTPALVEFREVKVWPRTVRVGETLNVSGLVIDLVESKPVPSATVAMVITHSRERQFARGMDVPAYSTSDYVIDFFVSLGTDSRGRFDDQVVFDLSRLIPTSGEVEAARRHLAGPWERSHGDARIVPGRYDVNLHGPYKGPRGQQYHTLLHPLGRLEVHDSASIQMKAVTGDDLVTRVSGRIETGAGVPLAVPLTLYLDGRWQARLESAPDGTFEWTVENLAPGDHHIRVRFAGIRFVDGAEATVTHDPSFIHWKVDLSLPYGTDVTMSKAGFLAGLSIDGDEWPPSSPLSLAVVAEAADGTVQRLATLPVSGRQMLASLPCPEAPGPYRLRVGSADLEGRHRVICEPVEVSFFCPTRLTLRPASETGGRRILEGHITALGEPVRDGAWELTLDGKHVASGLTDDEGRFFYEPAAETGLQPGSYQAHYIPAEDSYHRACSSGVVRVGFPSLALIGGSLLLAAGLVTGLAWRAELGRRRRRAEPAPVEAPTGPEPVPAVDPESLPPRERVVYLYGIVLEALSPWVAVDPARGDWDYWRRVSARLPEARGPLAELIRIYQEARYSRHAVGEEQALEAMRLAEDLKALCAAAGESGAEESGPASMTQPPAGPRRKRTEGRETR